MGRVVTPAAVLAAAGLTCLVIGGALAFAADALTETYEGRHRVQALGVALVVAAVWLLVAAGDHT